jgi:hypothetical protein
MSSEDRLEQEIERLRGYLNPAIRGENVDKVLETLAKSTCHLIENVEAVNDQLYIATASGQYLDQLLAGRNITRPDNVGLSDDIFREIGIAVSTRKQVRDLIHEILRIMYGEEFVRATINSDELETYALEDGDTLIMSFDDQDPVEVTFSSSQFSNINTATAQEVADAITKDIRRLGKTGSAFAKDDGLGGYVVLISETNGPSSSVKVLGGKAQNKLKFPQIRSTSGLSTTQWTLTQESGGVIRATWTGGPDPKIGKVQVDDYVNIYGSSFDAANRGTFDIVTVVGGLVNESYVEWVNPSGIAETTTQGTTEGILFFNPIRNTLNSKLNYAAAYQTENRILEVFMPATTKVVRRERQGAAYLHESGASTVDDLGAYLFDTSKAYIIGQEECNLTQDIDESSGFLIEVDDASDIPDDEGYLVFGFGTSKEEGPVHYISRPATNQIILNASYVFQNTHDTGTNISLVSQNSPYDVSRDGSDYPFYITDVVSGRIYAEELIDLVAATGINVIVTILYPSDEGLGKWGTENSEKIQVWGEDPV